MVMLETTCCDDYILMDGCISQQRETSHWILKMSYFNGPTFRFMYKKLYMRIKKSANFFFFTDCVVNINILSPDKIINVLL